MIQLVTAIYQQINNAHSYDTMPSPAPVDATYPFVTYKLLPLPSTEKDRDDYTLEVSCWDKTDSSSHARVLGIAEDVKLALLRFRHLDEYNLIVANRPSLGFIPDPDKMIKRYDVTSILKTYRR